MSVMDRLGGSDRHWWLMRRDLGNLAPAQTWPGHIQITPFTFEDAPEAHALLLQGHADDIRMPEYQDWVNDWRTDPEYDPTLCFALRDEQGMVGLIQGWTSAFIKDLVVHPRARNQGLALQLLNHVFNIFRQRGEAWVDLKVMENNLAARCLYEKAGMRYVQRQETDQA
ncbi:GNAT family N-acetyltransferase [Pseudomonas syringae group sp. J309-1]|uniref:GNAT family N-acetyltransferase n=1 Tax=Pseudomonas syringae group sp. J309-1 TaxID=3079588 RepID=UPI00210E21DE|nr:GNAT family N-acetyltransferase [Pseudomonas syringae group sp. J309-1]MCQ3001775.1 GNAT family N-acetyltransferase [Pseudomonas syringae]MCQ3029160.1 GNAT family N-acetyltransferase [Pseudomonas syringae]MDU8359431.1 GNAT family N-acetyltransferase [Pseudomonas syringae group sp. J309-1]